MNKYELIKKELNKIKLVPDKKADFNIILEKIQILSKEFISSLDIRERNNYFTVCVDIKNLFYFLYLQDYDNSSLENKKKYLDLFGYASETLYGLFIYLVDFKYMTQYNQIKLYIEDFEGLIQFLDQDVSGIVDEHLFNIISNHENRITLMLFKLIHEAINQQLERNILSIIEEFFEYKKLVYNRIEIPLSSFDNRYKPSTVYKFDLNYEYFYILISYILNNDKVIYESKDYGDNFKLNEINAFERILRELNKIGDKTYLSLMIKPIEDIRGWKSYFEEHVNDKLKLLNDQYKTIIKSTEVSEAKLEHIRSEVSKNLLKLPLSKQENNGNNKEFPLKFKAAVMKDYLIEGIDYIDLVTPELGKLTSEYLFGHLLNQLPSEPSIYFKDKETFKNFLQDANYHLFIPRNIFRLFNNNFSLDLEDLHSDSFHEIVYNFSNNFKTYIKLTNFPLYPLGIKGDKNIDGLIDLESLKIEIVDKENNDEEVNLLFSVSSIISDDIKKFKIIFGNNSDV